MGGFRPDINQQVKVKKGEDQQLVVDLEDEQLSALTALRRFRSGMVRREVVPDDVAIEKEIRKIAEEHAV